MLPVRESWGRWRRAGRAISRVFAVEGRRLAHPVVKAGAGGALPVALTAVGNRKVHPRDSWRDPTSSSEVRAGP